MLKQNREFWITTPAAVTVIQPTSARVNTRVRGRNVDGPYVVRLIPAGNPVLLRRGNRGSLGTIEDSCPHGT